MPPEIVQTLSTDQKNSYNLIPPVKQGKLDDQLAKIICGELSSSRWCTTGEALLMLWMSDHGLTGETLRILEVFTIKCILHIRFTINVYFI